MPPTKSSRVCKPWGLRLGVKLPCAVTELLPISSVRFGNSVVPIRASSLNNWRTTKENN